MDICIKDGTIVTANDIFKADIGIQNGKIVALGQGINGLENIDAAGKYILPGVIEVHTHFEAPFGHTRAIDNYFKGTLTAACGGVTTILDTVIPKADESLSEAVKNYQQRLNTQAVIDYGLHVCIPEAQENYLEEIPELLHAGISSFEVYLFSPNPQWVHSDSSLLRLMETLGKAGGLLMVHCGNQAIFEQVCAQYPLSDPQALCHYPSLCSPESEAEGVFRLMTLAQHHPCRLYLCHLSSQQALKQALKLPPSHPMPIYTSTDLHYLTHTEQVYQQKDALDYTVMPPLRSQADQHSLWQALRKGNINILSSDHWPFTREQKKLGEDLGHIPAGFANIELLLPLLYHQGVRTRHIDLTQLVALLSTNPARIFGLSDKGSIAVGKDADLVIFNPLLKKSLSRSNLHSESDFCLYEGLELQGYPEMTLSRGRIVYENGTFTGEQGAGQFIARSL